MVNEHDDRDETFWAPGTVALEDGKLSFFPIRANLY